LPVLFLTSSLLLALQASLGQQSTSLYNQALAQLRAGDYARGCATAAKVVDQEPGQFAAYNLLGVCAVKKGDGAKAETYFRKSVALNPRYTEARINLAVNLLQRGKPQAAIKQLEEVLQSEPNNATALYHLGKAESLTGATSNAIAHLRRAHELSPQDAQIALALARAHIGAGQRETAGKLVAPILENEQPSQVLLPAVVIAIEAEQLALARRALEQALRQDPQALDAILSQARDLSEQGNYKTVRALLEAVGPAAENSAEWNASLGYAEYKLGDPQKSSVHLRRAVELAPNVEEYYLKIGEFLLYHNSDDAAAAFFKTGLQNIPNSAVLHFALAVAYWAHQIDTKGSVEQLHAALKIEPDFPSALELLCVIYHREKNWVGLQEAADHLIQASPNLSTGYYFKGAALEARGRLGQEPEGALATARKLLEKSVRLQPQFSETNIALGRLLVESGELPRAIAELRQAIKIDPNDSQAYYHLAKAYRQAGELEKSEQALKQFKQIKAEKKDKEGWKELFQIVK
jgi:tetratricopeptide (TPR) repeat protein